MRCDWCMIRLPKGILFNFRSFNLCYKHYRYMFQNDRRGTKKLIKIVLKIINRPLFPKPSIEIILEGDVTHLIEKLHLFEQLTLAKLVFDIEQTLNVHLPQIRVHANLEEVK